MEARKSTSTSASTLRLFVEALQSLGCDWRAILQRCEIDPAALSDPDVRIPQPRYEQVWLAARDVTGDPGVGLHAGERLHVHAVNLLGYLMLSSATLGAGLRRIDRYQHVLMGEPWVGVREEGGAVRVSVGVQRGDPAFRVLHAEYVAALAIRVLEWVSETRIQPVEARFAHPPTCDPRDYVRALRCVAKFESGTNELVFDADTLARASLHADRAMARVHEEFGEKLLASIEHPEFTRRVRQALGQGLESDARDLDTVARRLGTSARSLQRRLSEERTSFRTLIDDMRRELATHHLLERRATPIEAVAYLAGFSEVSAFNRAVRRWFGRTPAQLREEARAAPEGSGKPTDR